MTAFAAATAARTFTAPQVADVPVRAIGAALAVGLTAWVVAIVPGVVIAAALALGPAVVLGAIARRVEDDDPASTARIALGVPAASA